MMVQVLAKKNRLCFYFMHIALVINNLIRFSIHQKAIYSKNKLNATSWSVKYDNIILVMKTTYAFIMQMSSFSCPYSYKMPI